MKIRAYLVLMAVAILVPVLIFSTVALKMLQNAERTAAIGALHETARATALAIDRELKSSESAMRVLGASPSLENGNLQLFYKQAKTADLGKNTWTVLFDSQGQQLINTLIPFGSPLPAPGGKDRIQHVMKTQQTYVSNLLMGPIVKRPVTTVNVPVPVENGQKYMLLQAYNADYFKRIISNPRTPKSWIIGIIDRDGRFIARSQRSEELVGQYARPEVVQAASASKEGELRHRTLDEFDAYTVFTHTELSGWTVAVGAPVDDIEAAMRRAIFVMGSGMLAAVIFATLAAILFGRRLVYSIAHASSSAALLGKGTIPETRHFSVTEVDALNEALTEAGEVLLQEKEFRQKAESEREQLLEREQKGRQLAEEQNKAKDAFLAMLGHELRNPLSAISAGIEVIKLAGYDAPTSIRAHEIIERQSIHLERIVDDLLDAGRMLTGKITLVKAPLNLASAASACLRALEASGRLDQHKISLQAEPAWVFADAARIDQVINNLIVNAVKYTPGGGFIQVSIGIEGQEAVLQVKDSGVGISSELLPHVFDPFVQGESSLDRAQGGLGIGLTMVRELVRLHGGTVVAASPGSSHGSVFIVRLPLIAAPDQEPDQDAVRDSADAPGKAYRVLLIEDNEDARAMTAQMLTLSGYHAVSAANGTQGLTLAKTEKTDAAVIDIGLPDINGYEVARRLRSDPKTAGMALIALTGYGLAADIRRAMDAGFDMHLTKPINGQRLKQAIEQCMMAGSV